MAYTTIDDPSAHFQTALYTGTGSSRSVTNDGNSDLQPDWIWIKERDGTGQHGSFDSSRGVQKELKIDDNSAEATASQSVTAFNSDGFTVGTAGDYNGSNNLQVAWQWKANGGTRTTFSEVNNDPAGGYQANTTAGFSIVDFTGTGANGTVSHGLGAVPEFIIVKNRTTGVHWAVYSVGLNYPTDDLLYLNLDNAANQHDPTWNNVVPTSSVFTVGSYSLTNEDSSALIAYVFTPIQGYSKFGSYTGNGNADGPFVYTGFKPAFLIAKETGATRNWTMAASKMQTGANLTNSHQPNVAGAQDANERMDWLSNGFKLRTTSTTWNTSSGNFIYAAFAENPFVTSTGIPCTAR